MPYSGRRVRLRPAPRHRTPQDAASSRPPRPDRGHAAGGRAGDRPSRPRSARRRPPAKPVPGRGHLRSVAPAPQQGGQSMIVEVVGSSRSMSSRWASVVEEQIGLGHSSWPVVRPPPLLQKIRHSTCATISSLIAEVLGLGHPNAPVVLPTAGWRSPRRTSDHHAQYEDLALLGRQDLEQIIRFMPDSRIGLEAICSGPASDTSARDLLGGLRPDCGRRRDGRPAPLCRMPYGGQNGRPGHGNAAAQLWFQQTSCGHFICRQPLRSTTVQLALANRTNDRSDGPQHLPNRFRSPSTASATKRRDSSPCIVSTVNISNR